MPQAEWDAIVKIENPTRQWLTMLAHTHMVSNCQPWSPAKWLLDHGIDFASWSPLPTRVRRREPKRCYWNSLELAARGKGRYVYMEGLACNIIPVDHAWCYDRETGLVVDTTWDHGAAYVGLPFRTPFARRCLNRQRPCVMNYEDDFPIMTGGVPVEQWYEPLVPGATTPLPTAVVISRQPTLNTVAQSEVNRSS